MYMAPEIWHNGRGGRKSDVWSVGVLAFEMFVGSIPTSLQRLERPLPSSDADAEDRMYRDLIPKVDVMQDLERLGGSVRGGL